jgi:hypothetical protein
MKHLAKIVGLCLASVLVLGMAITANASAAPVWETCREGATGTKYETSQCETALSSGKWAWAEVTGTESSHGSGTLVLSDTNIPIIGTVSVSCTGEGKGTVGPGKFGRVTEIPSGTISCSAGENCEKIEGKVEPRNLPWQTELFETEGKEFNTITNGKESEAPGWAVTCKVLGVSKTDTCTGETGATEARRVRTFSSINNRFELLVLQDFISTSPHRANCTVGGTGAGRVVGSNGFLFLSGGLR